MGSGGIPQNLAMQLQLQATRERLSAPPSMLGQAIPSLFGLSGLDHGLIGQNIPGRCPDSEQNPDFSNIQSQLQMQAILQHIQLLQQSQQAEQNRQILNFSPVPDQSRKRSLSSNGSSRRLSEEPISSHVGLARNSPSPRLPGFKPTGELNLQQLLIGKSYKILFVKILYNT